MVVASDPVGDAILAGSITGTVDLGGGSLTSTTWPALFVAKLDSAGHHVWSRSFENAAIGAGLAVDGLGDVVIADSFRDVTDFGGGPLTSAGSRDATCS